MGKSSGEATRRAEGTFEVTLEPQARTGDAGDASVGRMAIDKRFEGALVGSSRGEMLTAMTEVAGSAGYVAIERVQATVDGRTGTFALQHQGVMDRGAASLAISVVPDSGTGDLDGLRGAMTIDIVDGVHHYVFEYAISPRG